MKLSSVITITALMLMNSGCPVGSDPTPTEKTCTGNFYVRQDGNDANTGTQNTKQGAWRSIQKALSSVKLVGTTIICVGEGVYFETLKPTVTPSAENRLILKSTQGAIVDASVDVSSGWERATGTRFSATAHVYKRTVQPHGAPTPAVLFIDNKFSPGLLRIGHEAQPSITEFTETMNGGPKNNPAACCGTNRVANWSITDAVWGVEGTTTYLRFQNNDSPNTHSIRAVEKHGAAFNTNGKSYITVEGFTFRNSFSALRISGASSHITFVNNTVNAFEQAVYAINDPTPARDIVITHNTFDQQTRLKPNVRMAAADPNHWRIWQWYKYCCGDQHDRSALSFNEAPVNGVRFENNIVMNSFQGLSPGRDTSNLTVNDNLFFNLTDEAVDVQRSQGVNVVVRDNVVVNANNGFRVGAAVGPLSLYRNRIHIDPFTDRRAEGAMIYFYRGTTGVQRVYHNSMSGEVCFTSGTTDVSVGLSNVWLVNNMCSTKESLDAYAAMLFKGSQIRYNWFAKAPSSLAYSGTLGAGNISNNGQRYWNAADPGDWSLFNSWPNPATNPKRRAVNIKVTPYSYPYIDDGSRYANPPDIGAMQADVN